MERTLEIVWSSAIGILTLGSMELLFGVHELPRNVCRIVCVHWCFFYGKLGFPRVLVPYQKVESHSRQWLYSLGLNISNDGDAVFHKAACLREPLTDLSLWRKQAAMSCVGAVHMAKN